MSWIISLIIGGIVGWLASIVLKTSGQMGLIANVLVGLAGSLLGFWFFGEAVQRQLAVPSRILF
jgi:uncharacterized membrane protein YeaQ/YmgE (transglycosylase-associated protein family)